MSEIKFFIIFLLLCFSVIFGYEKKIIADGQAIDFLDLMLKDNVYIKHCVDVDEDKDHYYFLDQGFGSVFMVNKKNGKLVRVISRKGQGPNELSIPMQLAVTSQYILVSDKGYNGIKFFNREGVFVRSFKVRNQLSLIYGAFCVDENYIYIAENDKGSNTKVGVYNIEGQLQRRVIAYHFTNANFYSDLNFYIKIDGEKNLVLVFPILKNTIQKYDRNGRMLWENTVNNEIIDKFNNPSLKVNEKNISGSLTIFDLNINKRGDILVSHAGGAVLYSTDGIVKCLLSFTSGFNFGLCCWDGNKLLNCLTFGKSILLHDLEV